MAYAHFYKDIDARLVFEKLTLEQIATLTAAKQEDNLSRLNQMEVEVLISMDDDDLFDRFATSDILDRIDTDDVLESIQTSDLQEELESRQWISRGGGCGGDVGLDIDEETLQEARRCLLAKNKPEALLQLERALGRDFYGLAQL